MRCIVWEFIAKAGAEREFEKQYGPDGVWAQFFKPAQGYLGTELLRDASQRSRYFTVDRWVSQEAYDAFRASHREEYESIDRRCEALTVSETAVGTFVSTGSRADE